MMLKFKRYIFYNFYNSFFEFFLDLFINKYIFLNNTNFFFKKFINFKKFNHVNFYNKLYLFVFKIKFLMYFEVFNFKFNKLYYKNKKLNFLFLKKYNKILDLFKTSKFNIQNIYEYYRHKNKIYDITSHKSNFFFKTRKNYFNIKIFKFSFFKNIKLNLFFFNKFRNFFFLKNFNFNFYFINFYKKCFQIYSIQSVVNKKIISNKNFFFEIYYDYLNFIFFEDFYFFKVLYFSMLSLFRFKIFYKLIFFSNNFIMDFFLNFLKNVKKISYYNHSTINFFFFKDIFNNTKKLVYNYYVNNINLKKLKKKIFKYSKQYKIKFLFNLKKNNFILLNFYFLFFFIELINFLKFKNIFFVLNFINKINDKLILIFIYKDFFFLIINFFFFFLFNNKEIIKILFLNCKQIKFYKKFLYIHFLRRSKFFNA